MAYKGVDCITGFPGDYVNGGSSATRGEGCEDTGGGAGRGLLN